MTNLHKHRETERGRRDNRKRETSSVFEEVTLADVLFFLPACRPLHGLQRGGNAPLIHHSSVLTLIHIRRSTFSSPCVLILPLDPSLGVGLSLPLVSLSSLFISGLAHCCIFSVSLFCLARCAFI